MKRLATVDFQMSIRQLKTQLHPSLSFLKQVIHLIEDKMVKHNLKFSKAATTKYFLWKVSVARSIIKNLETIEIEQKQFYTKGIFKDTKRNVFISVYIGQKVKGFNKGRINNCEIRYSWKHHPELGGVHLEKSDLCLYVTPS